MTHLLVARVVAVGGVLLFWLGVFGAGAVVSGYSAREDYISSLASRGSPVAVLGVGALLASAIAHLATALAVSGAWRSRSCAACLAGAALASAAVAGFRISCPGGPARCSLTGTGAGDWVDAAHTWAVGAYEVCIVAAMLTLAVWTLRRAPALPPWLGFASAGSAVGSVLLLAQSSGDHVGMWQRLWLVNNLGWLLVVALVATSRETGSD